LAQAEALPANQPASSDLVIVAAGKGAILPTVASIPLNVDRFPVTWPPKEAIRMAQLLGCFLIVGVALELELIALRHQVTVLRRQRPIAFGSS
jgi:hypothetical protein